MASLRKIENKPILLTSRSWVQFTVCFDNFARLRGTTLKIFEFKCTLKARKLMKGAPLATICFEFLSVLALWIIVASQSQRMPSGITHLIPTLVTFSPSFFFSWFLRLQSQLFYHSHSFCQNLFREGQEPQISWDTFH